MNTCLIQIIAKITSDFCKKKKKKIKEIENHFVSSDRFVSHDKLHDAPQKCYEFEMGR